MANRILFVFEGGAREKTIAKSLQKCVFAEKEIVTCVFDAEIYQLYRMIKENEGFVTVFDLLKERDKTLAPYRKDYFGETYLFFDYDAHATIPAGRDGDTEIAEMLRFFNEGSETGKLYISYPMVEALWHVPDFDKFAEVVVKCKGKNCTHREVNDGCDECKKAPHYKTLVSQQCIPQLTNINGYNENTWHNLIKAHLCKLNYILTDVWDFPAGVVPQAAVFDQQLSKYIQKKCPEVAVLSAFPVFIHDYHGNSSTRKMLGL